MVCVLILHVTCNIFMCFFMLVGALIVQRPHDIETGYPQSIPVVYHYGHKSPEDNILLYNQLVSTLSQTVNARCEANKNGES